MLISPRQFPHPVLSYFSDDLVECDFQCTVDIEATGSTYSFKVMSITSSSDLNKLIKEGKACTAIHIDCPRTRYRKAYKSSDKIFSFHVDSNLLEGKVQVSRFILAEEDITAYKNEKFHSDYDDISFDIKKGDILALNETFIFDAEKEIDPLKNIPSIFSIKLSKQEDAPPVDIALASKINIFLSEDNYRKFKLLNQIQSLRPLLSQLILVPALSFVIEKVKKADDDEILEYEDTRWYKVLLKKLKDNGVEADQKIWPSSSIVLSQLLIGEPVSESLKVLENMMMEAD